MSSQTTLFLPREVPGRPGPTSLPGECGWHRWSGSKGNLFPVDSPRLRWILGDLSRVLLGNSPRSCPLSPMSALPGAWVQGGGINRLL